MLGDESESDLTFTFLLSGLSAPINWGTHKAVRVTSQSVSFVAFPRAHHTNVSKDDGAAPRVLPLPSVQHNVLRPDSELALVRATQFR